ncbi:MAG: hypothetical protein KC415_01490, partial [Anaerolineales bacterium]|nr:hypothetical protein [Anaerolineales bacterium]
MPATPPPNTETTILYDGSLGTPPTEQGLLYAELFPGPTQTLNNGGVLFDTSSFVGYQAGYAADPALLPTLSRTTGYTVTVAVQ